MIAPCHTIDFYCNFNALDESSPTLENYQVSIKTRNRTLANRTAAPNIEVPFSSSCQTELSSTYFYLNTRNLTYIYTRNYTNQDLCLDSSPCNYNALYTRPLSNPKRLLLNFSQCCIYLTLRVLTHFAPTSTAKSAVMRLTKEP